MEDEQREATKKSLRITIINFLPEKRRDRRLYEKSFLRTIERLCQFIYEVAE
jgi:hypothetical protein